MTCYHGVMSRRHLNVLCAAGVPLHLDRTAAPPALEEARAAIAGLARTWRRLSQVERSALHAWLGAFRDDWPRGFSLVAGAPGRQLLTHLNQSCEDWNRYIKLRRLAREALASWV